MLIEEPVQAAIWHCLNHYAYADATFLAERLFAETGTEDCLFLVATCYYRAGKVDQAYHLLQAGGLHTTQNLFLFVRCALDLDNYFEAESALLQGSGLDPTKELNLDDFRRDFGDKACFALQLLATIFSRTERKGRAVDAARKSLKLNPLLWKSYELICNLGEFGVEPDSVFDLEGLDSLQDCHGSNQLVNFINNCEGAAAEQQQQAAPANFSRILHTPQQQQQQTPGQGLSTPVQQLYQQTYHHQPSNPFSHQHQLQLPQQHRSNNTSSILLPVGTETPNNNLTPRQQQNSGGGNSNSLMETPLLYCNSVSTPMSVGNNSSLGGGHISGISSLNLTDSDSLRPSANTGLMPPPVRPKLKRIRNLAGIVGGGGSSGCLLPAVAGDMSPAFGMFQLMQQTPSPSGGVAAKILEFSSPQLMLLSSPGAPSGGGVVNSSSPPPVRALKSSLTSTPVPLPSRASTPSAAPQLLPPPAAALVSIAATEEPRPLKRVAMAAKLDNQKQSVLGQSGGNVITPTSQTPQQQQQQQPTRRSSRLFGSTQSSVKENSKGLGGKTSRISLKSPTRKSKPRLLQRSSSGTATAGDQQQQLSEMEKNEKNKSLLNTIREKIIDPDTKPEQPAPPSLKPSSIGYVNLTSEGLRIQKASASGLMALLRQLGRAYREAARYNSAAAISLLEGLPEHHAKSSWVLALLGKSHFELTQYRQAQEYFRQVRSQSPFDLNMMEYYSTTLWHLQEDVELSALAQELTRQDKLSPVSWCAAGNCFSHQKEHENAIRFFQRAVQVDSRFAYAYTLLGHEYVLVEELEKALSCFRTALRIDGRHYNAWYGIGLTYYKQERFQLAEMYFRKALAINPHSPVLLCHIAVVQHAVQKSERALDTLQTALELAPRNALCKFERASILHSMERFPEALAELNDLKEIIPKESPVYFLLGKVHNKLGNTHLALMHFSWAMDLDPKGANSQIKDALDPALNRTTVGGGSHDSIDEEDSLQRGEEEEEEEEEVVDDEERERLVGANQNSGEGSGLLGGDRSLGGDESSVFGENYSGVTPARAAAAAMDLGGSGGGGSLLNESDDSL